MSPFEFARLVELARVLRREIPPHCPTCGCRFVQWAGCNDEWHKTQAVTRG